MPPHEKNVMSEQSEERRLSILIPTLLERRVLEHAVGHVAVAFLLDLTRPALA